MVTQNERSVFDMDGLNLNEILLLLIYKTVMQEEYHLTLEKIKENATTVEQVRDNFQTIILLYQLRFSNYCYDYQFTNNKIISPQLNSVLIDLEKKEDTIRSFYTLEDKTKFSYFNENELKNISKLGYVLKPYIKSGISLSNLAIVAYIYDGYYPFCSQKYMQKLLNKENIPLSTSNLTNIWKCLQGLEIIDNESTPPKDAEELNYSRLNDIAGLVYYLNDELKDEVSLDGVEDILHGTYYPNGDYYWDTKGLDFWIKFNRFSFLRIDVGDTYPEFPYEDKKACLEKLRKLIENYEVEDNPLGKPFAFYTTFEEDQKFPHYEWVFANREEYAQKLIDNILFDDACIEDLTIIDSSYKQYQKNKLITENPELKAFIYRKKPSKRIELKK